MRIAALPMYDLPELQAANDALWAALRQAVAEVAVDPARGLASGPALDGFETPPEGAYDAILTLERNAIAQGYPTPG